MVSRDGSAEENEVRSVAWRPERRDLLVHWRIACRRIYRCVRVGRRIARRCLAQTVLGVRRGGGGGERGESEGKRGNCGGGEGVSVRA